MSLLIDVITDNIENNPHCFHGPTLLFRRRGLTKGEYYACSASRDRSDCSFYLKKSDVNYNKQSEKAIQRRIDALEIVNPTKLKLLRKKIKEVVINERSYCYTCCALFLTSDSRNHDGCLTINNVTDRQLNYPTEICKPRENDKLEAQYLFSLETTNHVVNILQRMGVKTVICVGTPRLHEKFIATPELGIKSLLLDIDPKYHYFYNETQFVWYNMFNNFAMHDKGQSTIENYLKNKDKIMLLIDPPFGGRVEPLSKTLAKINKTYHTQSTSKQELNVLWFFPYFMERHIMDSLPNFRMLDYQVNYENHASFSDQGPRKRKAGSPVRIFTNVPLSLFDLTGIPGYRLCDICGYWVSNSNWHCDQCNSCTSKNGSRYNHCFKCTKCVKPSYLHCETCKRCCLPSHICGQFQPDTTCYHCHQCGHKRSKCPNLHLTKSKKRKIK